MSASVSRASYSAVESCEAGALFFVGFRLPTFLRPFSAEEAAFFGDLTRPRMPAALLSKGSLGMGFVQLRQGRSIGSICASRAFCLASFLIRVYLLIVVREKEITAVQEFLSLFVAETEI